jgi:hypothetical protein
LLFEVPFDNDGGDVSDTFLYQVGALTGFATAPLYAVLHEACYGGQGEGTRWAAQRVRPEFPEFDARAALEAGAPVMFTGEMIYPWMFDLDPALRPLREAAEILATGRLAAADDPARLAVSEVPAAAAVYFRDMYVPVDLSLRTASAIRGLKPWVTSEYEHDGLRVSRGRVLDHLIAMNRGEV